MKDKEYASVMRETLKTRMLEALKSSKYLFTNPEKSLRELKRSRRHVEDLVTESIQMRRGERA